MGIMDVAIDLLLANGFLWVRRCRALGQARFNPWGFCDGIGSIDDCTDRGPKSHGCIFWHLGCSFRCCAWFCHGLLSLGWLAFVANAHKVGFEPFGIARMWQAFKFVIRF